MVEMEHGAGDVTPDMKDKWTGHSVKVEKAHSLCARELVFFERLTTNNF